MTPALPLALAHKYVRLILLMQFLVKNRINGRKGEKEGGEAIGRGSGEGGTRKVAG